MRAHEKKFPKSKRETMAEFKARLRKVALSLSQEKVKKAVGSMTRRCATISAAKGDLFTECSDCLYLREVICSPSEVIFSLSDLFTECISAGFRNGLCLYLFKACVWTADKYSSCSWQGSTPSRQHTFFLPTH